MFQTLFAGLCRSHRTQSTSQQVPWKQKNTLLSMPGSSHSLQAKSTDLHANLLLSPVWTGPQGTELIWCLNEGALGSFALRFGEAPVQILDVSLVSLPQLSMHWFKGTDGSHLIWTTKPSKIPSILANFELNMPSSIAETGDEFTRDFKINRPSKSHVRIKRGPPVTESMSYKRRWISFKTHIHIVFVLWMRTLSAKGAQSEI